MRLRHLAIAALALVTAAALTAATAVPAIAAPAASSRAPSQDWPDYAVEGTVYRTTPVYPSSPDGWVCHFGGECRPAGVRYGGDPDPIDTLQQGQQVRVRCQFGNHVWAEIEPDRTEIGWIGLNTISLNGHPDPCGVADWAWGWRRWG